MTITIYHNPRCSKSRKTLDILKNENIDPAVIEYLKSPPSPDTILLLARALDMSVADLLRPGESEYAAVENNIDMDDDLALAQAISRQPILLQRPIVVNESTGIAVIGRPPENVLELIAE